ncbi:MAG: cell division protein FtsZ [Bacteroidales bacterium]|jgi:cell division protein FtsZ|nr:cell division protein FtsZ [Bacteroidales bacterium]
MSDLLDFAEQHHNESIIKVLGVGGGGSNAVNFMYKQGIKDVDFAICNTDYQALDSSDIPIKVQLGATLTEGLGAGSKPERGREAAIESMSQIEELLTPSTKMIFVTAGMGGGTGTGAAPIIAQAAQERGILTVGIVTIPFKFEGPKRIKQAIAGLEQMQKVVDALLVIKNDRLKEMYGDLGVSNAFARADNILAIGAKGIAEIITTHGHINVDFADVETVMRNSGVALMGSGNGQGEDRAVSSIKNALLSPLLNNNDILGASDILINITSNPNKEATMSEVDRIQEYVLQLAGENASVIMGLGSDETLDDEIHVTIIATGFSTSNLTLGHSTDKKTYTLGGEKTNTKEITQTETKTARVFDFEEKEKELLQKVNKLYDSNGKPLSNEDAEEIPFGIKGQLSTADYDNAALMEAFQDTPAYKRKQKDALK